MHVADGEARCEVAVAACLVGQNPESPSVGRPEGRLCNLRSVHIDRHAEN